MSLGVKSLVLIAVVMALSVLAQFSIIGKVALPGLVAAERGVAVDRLKRARAVINESGRSLDDFARDWASWQDTAAYLADPAPDYPHAELVTGTLLAEEIDLFGLYDTKGDLVWGALPERRLASISIDAESLEAFLSRNVLRWKNGEKPWSGVTSVSGRAAFYSLKPVAFEDYGAGVVGYLAMLRFIDGATMTHWESLVGGTLELVPRQSIDGAGGEEGGDEIEAMRVRLEGPDGKLAFWLRIKIEHDSFQAARASLRATMNYTLIIGAVAFFTLLVGFRQLILRPVSRLTREVLSLMPEDRSYSMKRLAVRGRDEAGIIASEINEILERLERAASESEGGGLVSNAPRKTTSSTS